MLKIDWNTTDWKNGTASPNEYEAATKFTFCADWYPLRAFEVLADQDPLAVYGDILPLLRNSDINLINVETALGHSGERIVKCGPNFRTPESYIDGLTSAPFHIACLANNHIMDYGAQSLRDTMQALQHRGLSVVGAGMTGAEAARPLVLNTPSSRVAVVNCGEAEACRSIDNGPGAYGFVPLETPKLVSSLRRNHDAVFVVFHGGREYAPVPPPYVVDWLRTLAHAGATAVIAHHPHVPQGIEIVGETPIVYSQGNFVFWQDKTGFYNHTGYTVHLDLHKDRLTAMRINPYVVRRDGLSLLQGKSKAHFLQTLQAISALLADGEAIRSCWDAFADQLGLESILQRLDRDIRTIDPAKREQALYSLYSQLTTPAHNELHARSFLRASRGQFGHSPAWAQQLVAHWQQLDLEDGLEAYAASCPLPANDRL